MKIKETAISYCQVCHKDFTPNELVYFATWDNNIICQECAEAHHDKELRIYVDEKGKEV